MTLSHIPVPLERIPPSLSAEFNALPLEIRTIGCGMELMTRIQQLEMEKARLTKNHKRSMDEVNEHIKNCIEELKELGYHESTH